MRMHLLLSLVCSASFFSASAFAHPVFDALSQKRYSDALSASKTSDAMMRSYATWSTLKEPGGHTYLSFSEAASFFLAHTHWPLQNKVRLSVEAAMLRDGGNGDLATRYCREFPPISGRGMIACANIGAVGNSTREALLKQGWMQGDFEASEEASIRQSYSAILTANDHAARVERLLYEGKVANAQRILPLLPPSSRAISEVRIALITGAKNADAKLAALPAASKAAPGIVFDRIRYRHKKGLSDGAMQLFTQAPTNPPHADAWWPLRAYYTREAISRKQYSTAYAIVRHAGVLEREANAEALWLAGWLQYEFLRNPRGAYEDFYKLHEAVSTPVSKSRAAYWAGRAAEKNGNTSIANEWYDKAAEYPTVFYGQLAFAKRNPGDALPLPSSPSSGSIGSANQQLLDVAYRLQNNDYTDMARVFMEQIAASGAGASELQAVAKYVADKSDLADAVRLAKGAIRRNIVLTTHGWPVRTLPPNIAVEPALALAIARQESEFDPRARSHANAQGLMQLLPGTASATARKHGLPLGSLFDPAINMPLGSAYLADVIASAGGSYVGAFASYNAGPGNYRKWVASNGRPGQSIDQTLRWIESIPFAETRNYVQRVMENLQVYRARLNPDAPLQIEKDLLR